MKKRATDVNNLKTEMADKFLKTKQGAKQVAAERQQAISRLSCLDELAEMAPQPPSVLVEPEFFDWDSIDSERYNMEFSAFWFDDRTLVPPYTAQLQVPGKCMFLPYFGD